MPVLRSKFLLLAAAAMVAIPAIAQNQPESLLPPVFEQPPATPTPSATPTPTPAEPQVLAPRRSDQEVVTSSDLEASLEDLLEQDIPPPVELPDHARRDPFLVGPLPTAQTGFAPDAWGRASGKFLSTLMRRTGTPIASRWAHILLRNALLTQLRAPTDVHPADWVAERAWLLLRMGEADGARLLVSGVDVRDFTPKLYQVAVQSALANADPSGLCPLEEGLGEVEPKIKPLVGAMCSSLAGASEAAAADIDAARRRGRLGGIDLALADKVVGAGADTSRAVTIEWEPVEGLTAWRFGLAAATGMVPPQRLLDAASPQVRAWQARAPLFTAETRLPAARIATGLGVFSSQALMDLYAAIYDATDPSDLAQTDAWQVRIAIAGKDTATRIAAMRRLWSSARDPREKEAIRALLARAASRVEPDADLEEVAPELIASMLAGGYDREAARWAAAIRQMSDENGDRCWAMLALAAPGTEGLDLSFGRINAFIDRDQSKANQRSALLVAALAGLGRIDGRTAGRLNSRHELGINRRTSWSSMIDAASGRRQSATVAVLTGVGMQTNGFDQVPALHLFHSLTALNRNGQSFAARMIAAEALSRT